MKKPTPPASPAPPFYIGQLVWHLGTDKMVKVLKVVETLGLFHVLGSYDGEIEVKVFKPNELQG